MLFGGLLTYVVRTLFTSVARKFNFGSYSYAPMVIVTVVNRAVDIVTVPCTDFEYWLVVVFPT